MSALSNPTPTVLRYGRWRNRLLSGTVTLALAVLLWFEGEQGLGRWIGMVFMGVLALLCLLPSETRFDFVNRVIERRWKFLGLLTIFRRHLPLAQFREICWQSVGSWDQSSSHNSYAWKVGLESISGRRVFVSYFNAPAGSVCEEAKQFALELSKLTGLPLSPEIDAG